MPIDVEPDTFDAASKVVGQNMAGQLADAVAGLEHGLAETAAMGGSDPGGLQWAAAYDQAASATAGVVTDLTNACYKIAAMLEVTGFNHGAADDASNPRHTVPTRPDTTTYDPQPSVTPTPPPSARGGTGDPPTGWGLIQHAVGYVWPNGDTGKLRAAAQAWSAAASTVDGANRSFPEAIEAIRSQQSPEVDDAATVCQNLSQHIEDTATSCRDLATACTDYANHLDQAHQDVENELADLVASTAVIEGAGVVFTEVAGELWAQGVEAGRVAAAAARVSEILGPLADTVAAAAESVTTTVSKVAQVAQRLKVILGAQITRATAAVVERLPGLAKDAETAATDDLESAAGREGCFVAGTLVHTPAGQEPIEQLSVGDLVLAADPVLGVREPRSITATVVHTVPTLLDITVDGELITCSPEHPFWTEANGWTKAADLAPGDTLVDANGHGHVIGAIARRDGEFAVHNIEVNGLHSYYVSTLNVLVHNKAWRVPEPVGEPKRVSDKWLKNKGVDPHDVKDYLDGPVSHYDIYVDRNGNMFGVLKGQNPRAGEYLGNVNDYGE